MRRSLLSTSTCLSRRAASCTQLDPEAGFTLIELLVSALIVVTLAAGIGIALISTGHFSADQRHRSEADQLAEQDQERLRGMSAKQLNGLSQSRTVTLDGTRYTIASNGQFVSDAGGQQSCTASTATADYLEITSDVTWGTAGHHMTEQSIVAPQAGGTLLTKVMDQTGNPLSGVTIAAQGPDVESNTTNANGCVIFGGVAVGSYTVTASATGYVDPNGHASASGTADTNASSTSQPSGSPFSLGRAGSITATFTTAVNPGIAQAAPSISWFNTGMASSQHFSPTALSTQITTPTTLYPFVSGGSNTYTNNYTVWAGSCDNDQPPAANASYASVQPGGSASAPVALPGLIVKVTNKTKSGNQTTTSQVTPDDILITDGCGQSWYPRVRSSDPANPLGQLALAGQPYAPSGQPLTVCADFKGSSTYAHDKSVSTPNANFTSSGTTITIPIDSTASVGSNQRC